MQFLDKIHTVFTATLNNNNNNCRPDVVILGNPFDTMKRFCLYSQSSMLFPPKPLDTLPHEVDAQKGLDAFRFFLNTTSAWRIQVRGTCARNTSDFFGFRFFGFHFEDGLIVVVVVVFTLTDRASTIHSNIRGCQSDTWSQRGTKVNGSHHGDNPLLRPTGIQIATKSYATLQAMAPTNNKTVHQTSFTPYREQPQSTRIVY